MHLHPQLSACLGAVALVALSVGPTGQEWPVPVAAAELGLTLVTADVPVGEGRPAGSFVGLAVAVAEGEDPAPAGDRMVLPFARPVAHVDLARYADGTVVVLAGGIDSDLQIFRLGAAAGSVAVMEGLVGRRRVAESFDGGHGAWPARIERGLFVAVCEGVEQPELRGWDGAGRSVIDPRPLPVSVAKLSIAWDRYERRVSVVALGPRGAELAVVDLLHPLMPELGFEGDDGAGQLAFAESAVERRVTLVNRGTIDFEGAVVTDVPEIAVRVDGGAFEAQPRCWLPAGGRAAVWIRWRGPAAAERVATLSVQGRFPGVGARLRLGWSSETASAAVGAAVGSGAATDASGAVATPPPAGSVEAGPLEVGPDQPDPVREVPYEARILGWNERAARRSALSWSETKSGLARAELWLVGSGPGAATVRVRNARTGIVVAGRVDPGASRPVVLEIAAAAFDELEILPAERGFPVEPESLGSLGPMIHRDRDLLVITAAPHAAVLLAEGLGIPLVPISLREGRADAVGRFTVDYRALGAGVGAVTALVMDPASGRVDHSPPLQLPPPSGAIRVGSGVDRGN